MSTLLQLSLLVGIFTIGYGAETEDLEPFVEDLIKTWRLRSLTILFEGNVPKMCMSHQWLLCLSNDQNTNALAAHLDLINQQRKQDGLIFIGNEHHAGLIKHISDVAPSLFRPNYPLFMPFSYQNDIKLRLDSNIIFFMDNDNGTFELHDIFAVKGGPLIRLEVGKWNFENGISLTKSMSRWDRRTNLHQTTLVNCFCLNPGWAEFIKDENNNTIGSEGHIQDMLHYVTGKLNVTIEIVEAERAAKLVNGSWNGPIGFLQRQEADVVSAGLGVNLQRSDYIDYIIPTTRGAMTLIAAIPKGGILNIWSYVEVFGIYQWIIFVAFMALMVIGLTIIHALSDDLSGREFGTKRGSDKNYQLDSVSSALSMVFLYVLQSGSHTNSKKLAIRILTLTMSILTLIFFVFYTGDITAKMTSGPPNIPIRTFDDVIANDYKVVTWSGYYRSILASSKEGSAKLEVYKNRFELIPDALYAKKAVIEDPDLKTLLYGREIALIPRGSDPRTRIQNDKLFALEMDDSIFAHGALALQKDSEFLQIFNHYILRALEGGEIKRSYIYHHKYLFVKENFGIIEPQPLRPNNVMFCFSWIGFGVILSVIIVMTESIKKVVTNSKDKGRGGSTRWATTINQEESGGGKNG